MNRSTPLVLTALLLTSTLAPLVTATSADGSAGGNPSDFRALIRADFTSGANAAFANTYFGVRTGATSGYDSGLDAPIPPPSPGTHYVDAFYNYPANGAPRDRLARSVIAPGDGLLSWPLIVETGRAGGNVVLTWDAAEIAVIGGDRPVQLIPHGDECNAIDMRTTTSHEYSIASEGGRRFTVQVVGPDAPQPILDVSATIASEVLRGQPLSLDVLVDNRGGIAARCVKARVTLGETVLLDEQISPSLTPEASPVPLRVNIPTTAPGAQDLVITVSSPTAGARTVVEPNVFVIDARPQLGAAASAVFARGTLGAATMTVTNAGNRVDDITLGLPANPAGWTFTTSPALLRLEPGQSGSFQVQARHDGALPAGSDSLTQAITVTAISNLAHSLGGSATATQTATFVTADRIGATLALPAFAGADVDVPVTATFVRALHATDRPVVELLDGSGNVLRALDGTFTTSGWSGVLRFTAAENDALRQVRVRGGKDVHGLALLDATSSSLRVDSTTPSVALTLSGTTSGAWYTSPVTVTLSAADTGSGIREIRYWTSPSSPAEGIVYSGPFTLEASGVHALRATAFDRANNAGSTTRDVRIDRIAPTTSHAITGTLGSSGWFLSPVSIALVATDAHSGVDRMTWNHTHAPAHVPYAAPFAIDASTTVHYRAFDVAGNRGADNSIPLRVDTVAPVITTSGPTPGASGWHTTTPTFALAAADVGSGIESLTYTLDGVTRTYSAPFAVSGDGVHTLVVSARDRAGHATSLPESAIRVDTVAPVASLALSGTSASPPAPGTFLETATLSISATDATSGVARREYRIDGGAWQAYTAPVRFALVAGDGAVVLPANDATRIEVRAIDNAGLVSAIGGADLTLRPAAGPTAVSLVGIAGNAGWFRSAVTAIVTAAADERIEFALVSGTPASAPALAAAASTGALSLTVPPEGSGDGTYTLFTRVVGASGAPTATVVRVDRLAPTVTGFDIRPVPAAGSDWLPTFVTGFLAVPPTDATSGIATVSFFDNGELVRTVVPTAALVIIEAPGRHDLQVVVTDVAGNSVTLGRNFGIDATNPTVALQTPHVEELFIGETATVRFTASDNVGIAAQRIYYTDAAGRAIPVNAFPVAGAEGTYQATLTGFAPPGGREYFAEVTDLAGRVSRTAPRTFEVRDATPPDLDFDLPHHGDRLIGSVPVELHATDEEPGVVESLTVTIRDFATSSVVLTRTLTTSPYAFTWDTTLVPNGPYVLEATAVDDDGNVNHAVPVDVFVLNPPTLGATHIEATFDGLRARQPIRIDVPVSGASAPYAGLLGYVVNGGAVQVLTASLTSAGTMSWTLPTLPDGAGVDFVYAIADAHGAFAVGSFEHIDVAFAAGAADPTERGGAGTSSDPELAEHDWVRLVDAGKTSTARRTIHFFEIARAAGFRYDREAAYVVRYDVTPPSARGSDPVAAEFELNATYTPEGVWSSKWFRLNDDGTRTFLRDGPTPVVSGGSGGVNWRVSMTVFKSDVRTILRSDPTADLHNVNIQWLAYGSLDFTAPVAVDIDAPVITLGAVPANVRDDRALAIAATVTDPNFVSAELFYSIDGAAPVSAGRSTTAGAQSWTIPSAPGAHQIAFYVVARDAESNLATTPTTTVPVKSTLAPAGRIGADGAVNEGTPMTFRAVEISNAGTFAWTFRRGDTVVETATGGTVARTFTTPGEYTATLRMVNPDNTAEFTAPVHAFTVRDVLAPTVSITSPASGAVLAKDAVLRATATDTSGAVASVEASFDNGATWIADASAPYEFAVPNPPAGSTGIIVALVRATDGASTPHVSPHAVLSFKVDRAAPTGSFSSVPTTAVTGTPVTFAASAADDAGAVTFAWAFSDGTSATGASTAKTFTTAGTHTVTLVVRDAAGNALTLGPHTITVVAPPVTGGSQPNTGGGSPITPTTPVTPTPTTPTGTTVAAPALDEARRLTGLSLAQAFEFRAPTQGAAPAFIDPTGTLAQLHAPFTWAGSTVVLIGKAGDDKGAFVWDVTKNLVVPVTNPVPVIVRTVENGTLDIVEIRVEKSQWIYFTIPDPLPGLELLHVRAADGRILAPEQYTRGEGRLAVIDDPDEVYELVYKTTSSCPPRCDSTPLPETPELPSEDSCPPRCPPPGIALPAFPAAVGDSLVVSPEILAGVIRTVEFFVDGVKVAESSTAPFEVVLDLADLPAGVHVLRVVATDPAGQQAESQQAFNKPQDQPIERTTVTPGAGQNVLLWVGIAVVALAIVAGTVVVLKKRK